MLPESRLSRKAGMTNMHANISFRLERKLWSRICNLGHHGHQELLHTKQLGPVTFSIGIHDGQVWKHHINHFKALGDQNTQVFPIEPDKSDSEFMNTPSEISSVSTTQQLTVPSSADTESNTTQAAAVATSPTSSTSHYPTRDQHPPDVSDVVFLFLVLSFESCI